MSVLRQIQPQASESQIEAAAAQIVNAAQSDESTSHGFWSARHRVPILLAFLIAFFNQLSGINAVLYFAPRIFELTGLGGQSRAAAIHRHRRDQFDLHLHRPVAH